MEQPTDQSPTSTTEAQPVVIGLYGLPGSGKTTLLDQLKQKLTVDRCLCFEGCERLELAMKGKGDMEDFKKMGPDQQDVVREKAIKDVGALCKQDGQVGIVTGHFSF